MMSRYKGALPGKMLLMTKMERGDSLPSWVSVINMLSFLRASYSSGKLLCMSWDRAAVMGISLFTGSNVRHTAKEADGLLERFCLLQNAESFLEQTLAMSLSVGRVMNGTGTWKARSLPIGANTYFSP